MIDAAQLQFARQGSTIALALGASRALARGRLAIDALLPLPPSASPCPPRLTVRGARRTSGATPADGDGEVQPGRLVDGVGAWQNAFHRLARCHERRTTTVDAFFDVADTSSPCVA
ncbi:hypothetical protein [Streptomyces sp. C10]|uniref:hypothetical protein n=1 Tax=Streptomyces sp. C10 TaxID=531941 RepID=UPI00397EE478